MWKCVSSLSVRGSVLPGTGISRTDIRLRGEEESIWKNRRLKVENQ